MSLPPKSPGKDKKFISIEGNIGSGKSTILRIIKERIPELNILEEPLNDWQSVGINKDVNLLELYYNEPSRFGFTFQIYAFMSRFKKWDEYSHMDGVKGIGIS